MKKCGPCHDHCPPRHHLQAPPGRVHHDHCREMRPPPYIPPISQNRNIKTTSPQQVAISPTTYHQPPPPNPSQSTNIGFNSYQQNTHPPHCNTCLHQQVKLIN